MTDVGMENCFKDLIKAISESNKESTILNRRIFWLTIILTVLTLIMAVKMFF